MDELENLTPKHLRCPWGQCPGVYKRPDGRLIIVGKKADLYNDLANVGDDEYAIEIDPQLLADVRVSR